MTIKVLLVDDQVFDAALTMRAMDDCKIGHQFIAASDGHEALNALKKWEFDLILLDIKMPRVDGFEFLQLLREKSPPIIPVVILTGSNLEVDRSRAASFEAVEYVHKTMDYADFKDQLQNALARHGFC